MEIELVKREVFRRVERKTFNLKEGLEIAYYGVDYVWEEKPRWGEVKLKDGDYLIEWEDGQDETILDNSEQTKEILKYCGF